MRSASVDIKSDHDGVRELDVRTSHHKWYLLLGVPQDGAESSRRPLGQAPADLGSSGGREDGRRRQRDGGGYEEDATRQPTKVNPASESRLSRKAPGASGARSTAECGSPLLLRASQSRE